MAVNSIPGQLSNMGDRFSAMRTGVVESVNPVFAIVNVAGTAFNAAYIRLAEPKVGDTVAILRQGATWFVLGTTSASGANLVQNASFEEVTDTGAPVGWTLYISGANASTYESVDSDDAIDGTRVLEVMPLTVADATSIVYSQPISVEAGQSYQLSAYAGGYYPTTADPDSADAALLALWFANASNLYPTTASADTVVDTANLVAESPPMTILSGNVTVPIASGFMRVGLRTISGSDAGGLHWDFVVARLNTP